jgi:hypothetical protein
VFSNARKVTLMPRSKPLPHSVVRLAGRVVPADPGSNNRAARRRGAPRGSAKQRALHLLDEVRDQSWSIEFVETSPTSAVHVVAADVDQCGWTDIEMPFGDLDWLIHHRFVAVCGQRIVQPKMDGGILPHPFDDNRLCGGCHAAFPTHTDQALLFEYNTEFRMEHAASQNQAERQLRGRIRDRQAKMAKQPQP